MATKEAKTQMGDAAKRLGKEKSLKRALLIKSAEQILLEQGHAALSARHLAERAGVKFQSIYYYFNNLDDLFVEVLDQAAKENLQRIEQRLDSDKPLRALWNYHLDPNSSSGVFAEFSTRAKDNARIREALAAHAEQIRTLEIAGVSRYLERQGVDIGISPEVFAVLLASVTRNLRLERDVKIAGGHKLIEDFVEDVFARIEAGNQRAASSGPGRRATASGQKPKGRNLRSARE